MTELKVTLINAPTSGEALACEAAGICVGLGSSEKSLKHALSAGHESVLEHLSFTFRIEGISRACSHQLVRHRLASYSQKSQRYVSEQDFEYILPPSISQNDTARALYEDCMKNLSSAYRALVDAGVPKEDARYVLPNACATDLIMTMNARELLHFFNLRCCSRAQWEIREMANQMLKLCKDCAPLIFENAGPSCKKLGYCPEVKSCGKVPTLKKLFSNIKEER